MQISLFDDIFLEGNIMLMNGEFIRSMSGVLDINVCVFILKFIKEFEDNYSVDKKDGIDDMILEVVTLIKNTIGDDLRRMTFHKEVIERGIMSFMKQFRLDTCLSFVSNKDQMIENLTWLLENKKYWVVYINEREKDKLKIFKEKCYELEKLSENWSERIKESNLQLGDNKIRFNLNLTERIDSNIEFFYVPKQPKQYTGMSNIIHKKSEIEMFLHGLKYQKFCNEHKVSQYTRRDFSILTDDGKMI